MLKHLRIANTDLDVSCFCCGAMPFGTGVRGEEMHRLFGAFREAGGNFFDSAHCYCFWIPDGDGASEKALGECVRRSGRRDQLVIATKGGHPAVPPGYPRPDDYLSARTIASDIDQSLQLLGMDHIDLYWLHRDDPRVPAGEIIQTLNAEIGRGRIRYLGASNWKASRLAEANDYAAAHGLRGFAASQPQFSLAQLNVTPKTDPTMRFLTDDDIVWHTKSQLPAIPYSPTACGYFATAGQRAKGSFDNPISQARLARVQELAMQISKSPNQIALAWLMNQPFPVIPILGTTKLPHLEDALGAAEIRLTQQQVKWLNEG